METIRRAVAKIWPLFRREAFDFDDVMQEVMIGLLDVMPVDNQGLLYTISKRRAIDYIRLLSGRNKTYDRGQQSRASLDLRYDVAHKHVFQPEAPDHWWPIEVAEALDDIEAGLSGRKLEIFRLRRCGLLMKDIGEKFGVGETYISQVLKQIGDDYRRQHVKSINDRPSGKVSTVCPTDNNQVDRQRRVKRISSTR